MNTERPGSVRLLPMPRKGPTTEYLLTYWLLARDDDILNVHLPPDVARYNAVRGSTDLLAQAFQKYALAAFALLASPGRWRRSDKWSADDWRAFDAEWRMQPMSEDQLPDMQRPPKQYLLQWLQVVAAMVKHLDFDPNRRNDALAALREVTEWLAL
jgi:hypothetical protein